jgi:hypothetical protein
MLPKWGNESNQAGGDETAALHLRSLALGKSYTSPESAIPKSLI